MTAAALEKKLPFGKFKGWSLGEVEDLGYVVWLAGWQIVDGKKQRLVADTAHTWVFEHYPAFIAMAKQWLRGRCWHCSKTMPAGPEWQFLHKWCWLDRRDHDNGKRYAYTENVRESNARKRVLAVAMARQARLGAGSPMAWLPHDVWLNYIVPSLKRMGDD